MRPQGHSQAGSRRDPAPPPPARGLDAASRSVIEGLTGFVTSEYWQSELDSGFRVCIYVV